jgi:ABC-type lipoprotein release transport system permease subunit
LWVWFAGPSVLAAAVIIASVLPARRALMVDPVKLLRN